MFIVGTIKNLYNEKELSNTVKLCNNDGTLNSSSVGWAKNPIFQCNLSNRWLRKKKWNYWCITSDEFLFSVTISNIDYAGMVFAYFLDFKTNKFIEKTVMMPFGKGCSMPQTVHETVNFKNKEIDIMFKAEEDNSTFITAKCNDFAALPMEASFRVIYPKGYETLNVVVPWNNKTFQFTSKHEGMPVEGFIKIGEKVYTLSKENSFGCLDFGRGIWPYKVKWNWANASGIVNGKRIGLNLGAKWTDGTGYTENGIVINGKLTKLSEDIIFEYDNKDFKKPWIIKTELTNRVNLTFVPFYERIAKSNLAIIKSEVHQMIGYFSGTIETSEGEKIEIYNMLGCSEDHLGQW